MLPPSLRLLVRHQARFVPLPFQRRLKSTDTGPNAFAHFLVWARKHRLGRRAEQSHSQSGIAWGGKSSERRKKKKVHGPRPFHPNIGNPSNLMTREQRILRTVRATVGNKRETTATNGVHHWPPEDWKTDGWGLDSMSRMLNLRTVARTDHGEPEQNSSLHPRGEILPLGSRSL